MAGTEEQARHHKAGGEGILAKAVRRGSQVEAGKLAVEQGSLVRSLAVEGAGLVGTIAEDRL